MKNAIVSTVALLIACAYWPANAYEEAAAGRSAGGGRMTGES